MLCLQLLKWDLVSLLLFHWTKNRYITGFFPLTKIFLKNWNLKLKDYVLNYSSIEWVWLEARYTDSRQISPFFFRISMRNLELTLLPHVIYWRKWRSVRSQELLKNSATAKGPAPTYAIYTFYDTLHNKERRWLSHLSLSGIIQQYLDLNTYVYLTKIQLKTTYCWMS